MSEKRLAGCVVATTRDGDEGDPLVVGLRAEGAIVRIWPTLVFLSPQDPEPLRTAAEALELYDLIVFTSARAVEALASLVSTAPVAPRVAAVGGATRSALERAGWRPALTGTAGAAALARELGAKVELTGTRVLFPASSAARPTLEEALRARGARVDRVEAYRTAAVPPDEQMVRADLAGGVDVVTFTSPSAVHSLAEALKPDWPVPLTQCQVVTIGGTTAASARELGLGSVATSEEPAVASLIDECARLRPRTGVER